MKLLIVVDFEDSSDFDFYRHKFVGAVEAEVEEALDTEDAPHADGNITVEWDTED